MVGMGKNDIIPTRNNYNLQKLAIGYWLMMGKHGYPTSKHTSAMKISVMTSKHPTERQTLMVYHGYNDDTTITLLMKIMVIHARWKSRVVMEHDATAQK